MLFTTKCWALQLLMPSTIDSSWHWLEDASYSNMLWLRLLQCAFLRYILLQPCMGKSCSSDFECGPSGFCRPSQEGSNECTPYALEGDTCEAYTTMYGEQRCFQGLKCTDHDPRLPDLGGKCRQTCRGSKHEECLPSQYCTIVVPPGSQGASLGEGYCRDIGTCGISEDCAHVDNTWDGKCSNIPLFCESHRCSCSQQDPPLEIVAEQDY